MPGLYGVLLFVGKVKKGKRYPPVCLPGAFRCCFLASSLIIRKYTATVDISSHLNSWIISITAELLLMQV